MTKLHEWQAFARASGLRGWSRLKKDDLVRFLIENLWWGGGLDNPRMNKAARLRIRKHHKKNPLDEKNPAIDVPVLVPEKRLVSPKAIPKVVEKNVETVVDWLNWLENIEDESLKKEVDPAVEKLKQEIGELWEKQLVVEEGKSALKGFAKQFFIRGDDWVSLPQEFLLKARGHVVKLLQENPHTKVQCVLNCKMSRMIGDEEIVDEPFFHSRQKKNLGTNMEIVGEMENEMIENLENFNRGGSNWVFEEVLFLEIHFARWNPLRGSGWIALPPALQKKKALINMKNNDDMCFKWCIARAVNPVQIHPERITPILREQAEELNWEGCKFPMAVNKIKLFESRNPHISVNCFGWNGSVFPLKIVREEKEIHVDLLLLKTHFVLVKSFSRFLSSQVCRNGHERFFCKRCLNSFPRAESLEKHQALCNEFEATKIEVPGGICAFHNFAKMMHLPVVGYADFESILKPTRGEKGKGTVQTHEHIPCGFAFHLVSPFLQMEPVVKRAKDETEKLPQEFVRELISSVKSALLSLPNKKMFPLTKEEWKTFREAAVCWLCRKEFREGGNLRKVRDHCHFSGKFRGAAHSLCNFKFQRPKFTPVFFHNLQNYDAHLFVRALGTLDEVLEVTCIPNNEEKYISVSLKFELKKERREVAEGEWKEFVVKHEIRFLDSFKFTLAGLSSLVENLPKEELKETVRFFGEKSNLMTRKGVYPYEFMDGFEKFEKRQLPKQTSFFSRLMQEKVSDEDFAHAQKVWEEFGCKNMGDFHDLYLLSDVLLLADVMESFRKLCEKHYELDPAHFFTTPGLAWDAMLKMTDVKLELLGDVDQLLMIEKGIRGGNSNVFKRFAKANNKFMKNFDPAKKSKFLVYLDANNLYGWAMSQPLPVGDFAWMSKEELQNWEKFVLEEGKGCILEVDLEYPRELHDLHNDFPLAPEVLELGGCKKLTQNLRDKKEMVLHGRNLKQVLSLGMKLKSIKRGISFSEKPFMKCYIDKNTELRAKGKTKFEKEFFKLMNNSVFGKTMENLRKRVSIELVKDADRAEKLVMKPNFADLKIFDEFLIAIKMKKTRVVMNKPIFAGMTILDLSKLLMFNFHYGYVKKKWDRVSVLYTDTDSLVLEIETEDFFADIAADVKEWFDTNDFSPEHPAVLKSGMPIVPENKKKIGLMKDECCGAVMTEFVALKPKLYSFLTEEDEKIREKQKAKGVKKCIIKKSLRHENFVKCLNTGQSQMRKQSFFRSREHHLFTESLTKLALNPRDDKRVVLENGIDTLALGHWRVKKLCP